MRIQDFESRSGLERATIRYYEKEGLLSPQRTENGYRDYSEADLEEVKKIKLLRQLGMPLERIRELQQGTGNFSEAMDIQMSVLTDRVETQQWAIEVCREMKRSETDYPTLDADKYLNMLLTPPAPKPPQKPQTHREILRLDHHPGRRFFARYLDLIIMNILAIFLDEYPDMLWDDQTDVTYRMWSHREFSSIVVAVVLIFRLFVAITDDILLPKYRNNLTVSEFSDNYNFYASLVGTPYRLNPDGTWVDDPSTGGDGICDFTYTLEDGYITGICQNSVERGFRSIDPLHSYQTTFFLAFSAAQPTVNSADVLQMIEYWKEKAWYYVGDSLESDMYGVQFSWEIDYENCVFEESSISSRLEAINMPEEWDEPTDAYLHIIMTIDKVE